MDYGLVIVEKKSTFAPMNVIFSGKQKPGLENVVIELHSNKPARA